MNLKIVRLDTESIRYELAQQTAVLERIAKALEAFVEVDRPQYNWDTPDDDSVQRVSFHDERLDIVKEQLRRLGKEYKER